MTPLAEAMPFRKILCAGAALGAISNAAAMAGPPSAQVVVVAKTGNFALKTAIQHSPAKSITYTVSVTTTISTAADYKIKTKIGPYMWDSNNSLCQEPEHEKLRLGTRKTKYAKIGTAIETYSVGCGKPSKFYFTTYELETKAAVGKTDHFTASLKAKVTDGGIKYDATLNIDTSVHISR
jgi:hypothetical protein